MNKCLRVSFVADFPEGFLRSFIQKNARKFNIEGTVQVIDQKESKVRIIICGKKENVDSFVDVLHKGSSSCVLTDIEIEPFLKDRDYRGVFRVIE